MSYSHRFSQRAGTRCSAARHLISRAVIHRSPDHVQSMMPELPPDLPPDLPLEDEATPETDTREAGAGEKSQGRSGFTSSFLPPDLPDELQEQRDRESRLMGTDETQNDDGVEIVRLPALVSLPGFQVIRKLGQGGMGSVYLARDIRLGREVAIKMVAPHGSDPARMVNRFTNEIQSLAGLKHPNIAQLYSAGQHEDLPYFVMEYVAGENLEARAKQPMAAAEAVELMLPLCDAVAYCHQEGVLHRDLKPANVLLAKNLVPKIADFGLAKIVDAKSSATQTGEILGTPGYMAPEQASGIVKNITPACDVYALGAILYRLLSGRPPFASDDPVKTLMMVIADEPVAPNRLIKDLPRDLQTICLKCLEKKPSRRYATAAELAEDLIRFQNHQPIQARPTNSAERLGKWARRNPVIALGIGVSVLGMLAVVTGLVWHNSKLAEQLNRTERLAQHGSDLSTWLTEKHLNELSQISGTTTARLGLAHRVQEFLDESYADMPPKLEYTLRLGHSYAQMASIYGGGDWNNVGRHDEAVSNYQRALQLYAQAEKLAPADPSLARLQASAHLELSEIQTEVGAAEKSQQHFEQATHLIQGLGKSDYQDVLIHLQFWKYRAEREYQGNQSERALKSLGEMLQLVDKTEDRIGAEAGFVIEEDVAKAEGNLLDDRIFVATTRGRCLNALGELKAAIAESRRALELCRQKATASPNHAIVQRTYSAAMVQLADALLTDHQDVEALELYQQALKLIKQLAEKDAANVDLQANLALKHSRVASVFFYQEQLEQAEVELQSAIGIIQALAEKQRLGASLQLQLAMDLRSLSDIELARKEFQKAEDMLREQQTLLVELNGQVPEGQRLQLLAENQDAQYQLVLNQLLLDESPPSQIRSGKMYRQMKTHLKSALDYFRQMEARSELNYHQQQIRDRIQAVDKIYEDSLDQMQELYNQQQPSLY